MDTRSELSQYLGKLLSPLLPVMQDCAAIPRHHAASYSDNATRSETFSRILWGLAPALAGDMPLQRQATWLELYYEILSCGTEPEHPGLFGYWGTFPATQPDQRCVEMCAIAYSFLIAPDVLWRPLPERVKANVFAWLGQINQSESVIADNNWRFFRIFVNTFFQQYDGPFCAKQQQKDFAAIEQMYLGDGWYSDGNSQFHTNQRGYYIPMAMHFYGLLLATLAEKGLIPLHSQYELYKQRAVEFAPDFLAWFDSDGAAMPFGRSLTYRFAQGAFWSAFILAGLAGLTGLADCPAEITGVTGITLGQAKGLLMRHLRYWLRPSDNLIFDNGGLLSVGYRYANLYMSESYNAVGSPYWAQKAFAISLLPREHEFWKIPEEALPIAKENRTQPHARMLFQRSDSGHSKCLSAGQWAGFDPNHSREKFAKFSYSALFGFNVSIQPEGLARFAADSMLSFSTDGQFWAARAESFAHVVTAQGVASSYRPLRGVQVRSLLYPLSFAWHLRIHFVQVDHNLEFVEGSYSLPYDFVQEPSIEPSCEEEQKVWAQAEFQGQMRFAAAQALNYSAQGHLLRNAPNMNLIAPHSCLPLLRGQLDSGKHLLLSLCGGDLAANYIEPEITWQFREDHLVLTWHGSPHRINLEEWGLT